MKYKIGQQVIIKNHKEGKCSDKCAYWISCMDETIGEKAKILSIKHEKYFLDIDNEELGYSDCMLEEVSQMKYKEGDILVNDAEDERTVLGVCGRAYLMSYKNDFESSDDMFLEKELEEAGYKLKEEDTEVKKAIELLKKKGIIKDGKILEE